MAHVLQLIPNSHSNTYPFSSIHEYMVLEDCREDIDRINNDIAELIAERMDVVEEVGKYKKENNMEIKDEGREEVVKDQFADIFSENNLPEGKGRELAEFLIGMAIEEEEEVKEE